MKQGIITITRTGAVRRAVRPDLASPSYLNAYRAYPLPRIKPGIQTRTMNLRAVSFLFTN